MDNPSTIRKSSGAAIAALLIFGAVATAITLAPQTAYAAPTITTSTDTFYGNSLVEVIVADNTRNSVSTTQETIAVTVTTKSNTGQNIGSGTVNALEIGTNSGEFVFYVTTSNTVQPTTPRSSSQTTTSTVSLAGGAVVARANTAPAQEPDNDSTVAGTQTNDVLITTSSELSDGAKVEITFSGATKTVNFQTTTAVFSLDRLEVGNGNNVIFSLKDQDANVDPTAADTIRAIRGQATFSTTTHLVTATTDATDALYLDANDDGTIAVGDGVLVVGSFDNTDTSADLVETGPNTGVFEVTFSPSNLGVSSFTTPSVSSYVARDYDVYSNFQGVASGTGTAGTTTGSIATDISTVFNLNPTSSTNTQSLTFRNVDGSLTNIGSITFADEIPITVTDADRNASTASKDTLTSNVVTVTYDANGDGTADDSETVNLKETGDNTGIFQADLPNGKLPVTFLATGSSATSNNGKLELSASAISGNTDIVISYSDANPSSGGAASTTSTIRKPVTHAAGTATVSQATLAATDKNILTITDADLNDNSDAVESYTVTISTTANEDNIIAGIASIKPKTKGVAPATTNLAAAQTVALIETGKNTGVFSGEVTVNSLRQTGTSFSDGDQVELKYVDKMESPEAESTAKFTIGIPTTAIKVDKTAVGFPATATTDAVKVRVTITDASLNTDSSIQETLSWAPTSTSTPGTSGNLVISAEQSGGTALVLSGSTAAVLAGVTEELVVTNFSLTETGPGTGVFSGQVSITRTSDGTTTELNDAKVKFTYRTTEIATVTLRVSDLVLSTDKPEVTNGDSLTIRITDADRNLDPETKDTITITTIATQSDALTGTLGSISSQTAEETGLDTGVFEKTITIGKDLRVTEIASASTVNQAKEIKVSLTESIATDLQAPTRDLVVKVKSTSGSVSVTPEEVGPGTKISVLVTDNDLNINPSGTDTIQTSASAATEYVSLVTDRTNFPTTKVIAEETGPNTGVFKTTVKLTPLVGTVGTPTATSKDVTGFEVLPGDLISIKYTDVKDASGAKSFVTKVIKVISADPEMTAEKTSVNVGQTINFTVKDPDANTDGEVIDSKKVRVSSGSDPVGFDVTGLETGANTGVFTFSVTTTSGVSSGSLTVKDGDSVQLKYNDTYPADYATRVKQVSDATKDFFLNLTVGAPVTSDVTATTPQAPVTKDISGNVLSEVTTGSQVILSTDITNNKATSQQFAAIVEVRDADGITVYLQWQTGTLNANGSVNVGLSWTPDAPGTYTVRTFVLSSIVDPLVLSPVAESTITVS